MDYDSIIRALNNMFDKDNKNYFHLSKRKYVDLDLIEPIVTKLEDEKYLERPIAYEFYHQLRKLIDDKEVDLNGYIIQAEVSKGYQKCFEKGKIPDFIIHKKESNDNLMVIEFKLASKPKRITKDLDKLLEFKNTLQYKYLIEVVIGDNEALDKVKNEIEKKNNKGKWNEIIIIEFNTETEKVKHWIIR